MRIPKELADKLRRLAAADGLTGSAWIRKAIAEADEPREERAKQA
jgi:predicted DNA-binding protein